ncbi:hypothetical protein R1sor_000387 [Riccia sorocarpa]|uniref:Shugoshin C-terminal domain-containing protein n=1 Tax=Riccia sorocarpa TaxID=122646 RepID=A0ABD3GSZ0_9MARC
MEDDLHCLAAQIERNIDERKRLHRLMVESKLKQASTLPREVMSNTMPQQVRTIPVGNPGPSNSAGVERTVRQQLPIPNQEMAEKGKGLLEKDFPPLINSSAGAARRQPLRDALQGQQTVLTPAEQRKKHQEKQRNLPQTEVDDGFTPASGPKNPKRSGRIIPVGNRFEALQDESDEDEKPSPAQKTQQQSTHEDEDPKSPVLEQQENLDNLQDEHMTENSKQTVASLLDISGPESMDLAKEKRKRDAIKSGKAQGQGGIQTNTAPEAKQQGDAAAQKSGSKPKSSSKGSLNQSSKNIVI